MKQPTTKIIAIFMTTIIATGTILTGCKKPQESSATMPMSSVNTELIDSEVTRNVKTALHLDENIKGLDIAVTTLKGDVKLTGFADNQSQIDYVNQLVRNIQGVHTIHDELTIKQ